jgi:hypothetical protein
MLPGRGEEADYPIPAPWSVPPQDHLGEGLSMDEADEQSRSLGGESPEQGRRLPK